MAAITHWIPTGTTEAQTFQALADDAAADFTGATLALEVTDRADQAVVVTGTVAWVDASVGTWSYTPDGQLTAANSPYAVRLKITDGTGAIIKAPNGADPDTWWIVTP